MAKWTTEADISSRAISENFLFLLFKNKQKSASLEPLIGLLAFVVYGLKTTN